MEERNAGVQSIRVSHEAECIVVALYGYIDKKIGEKLAATLRPLYFHRTVIIVDLSEVKGIVSAALRVILDAEKVKYRNAEFVLCSSNDAITTVIEMVGLQHIFTTHFNIGAARADARIRHGKMMKSIA